MGTIGVMTMNLKVLSYIIYLSLPRMSVATWFHNFFKERAAIVSLAWTKPGGKEGPEGAVVANRERSGARHTYVMLPDIAGSPPV